MMYLASTLKFVTEYLFF